MPIKQEDFDGVTAPALPSGWTFGSPLATDASPPGGITPISSPNVLALNAPGNNTHYYGTYGTADSNGGAVSVSGYFNAGGTTNNQTFGLTLRGNASDLSLSGKTYLWVQLSPFVLACRVYKVVSGTQTLLHSVTLSSLAVPAWYQMTATDDASNNVNVTVQRVSDGYWLDSSGTFQPGAADVLSFNDSSVTGAGYAGFTLQSRSDFACLDRWVFDNLSPPTVVYGLDFAQGISNPRRSLLMAPGIAWTGDVAGTEILAPLLADLPATSEGTLATVAAADSGRPTDGQLPAAIAADVAIGAETSLAAPLAADSGAASEDLIATSYTATVVQGTDFDAELDAALWVALSVDPAAEAETGVEALVVFGVDAGLGTEETVEWVGTATVYTAVDPFVGMESAPAPTLWAADVGAGDEPDPATILLAGDAGTAFEADEPQQTITIFAADLGSAADLAVAVSILYGLDLGSGLEGAALDLVTWGYHVYANTGIGDPVDYDVPVATVLGFDNTTWISQPLASPGTWSFAVRAFNAAGDELNLDCSVTIILDATGRDITDIPAAPIGLRAFATAGGGITVEWGYPPVSGPKNPTGFHIYIGTGPTPDYGSPAATVLAKAGLFGTFQGRLAGLSDGTTYSIGVRAFNHIGEESNTTIVSVTADATGPSAVTGLIGVAIT